MVKVAQRKRGTRMIGVNDRGYAVGESHARAKLSEADIELILELREAGFSYSKIAKKFDADVTISKSHVRWICTGKRRGQVPTNWKRSGLRLLADHLKA